MASQDLIASERKGLLDRCVEREPREDISWGPAGNLGWSWETLRTGSFEETKPEAEGVQRPPRDAQARHARPNLHGMCAVTVLSTLAPSFLVEVQLIYNTVPVSAAQQSDSIIHIWIFFFNILFHYGLSQEIRYRSPCYPVGPCLSILNVSLHQLTPNSQSILLLRWPPHPRLSNHKSVLYVWVCFCFVDKFICAIF